MCRMVDFLCDHEGVKNKKEVKTARLSPPGVGWVLLFQTLK